MNLEVKVRMDLVPQPGHLCYVRCNFCNTDLTVGIPRKRLLDTVTIKCGVIAVTSPFSARDLHCKVNASIPNQPQPPVIELSWLHVKGKQSFCGDSRMGTQSSSSSSSTSSEPSSPKAPIAVKPSEKKHGLPSAYNRFMKEEIEHIKAANLEIPHREAFSASC